MGNLQGHPVIFDGVFGLPYRSKTALTESALQEVFANSGATPETGQRGRVACHLLYECIPS